MSKTGHGNKQKFMEAHNLSLSSTKNTCGGEGRKQSAVGACSCSGPATAPSAGADCFCSGPRGGADPTPAAIPASRGCPPISCSSALGLADGQLFQWPQGWSMANCSGGCCSSCPRADSCSISAPEEVLEVLESHRICELHDGIIALIIISILVFIIAQP